MGTNPDQLTDEIAATRERMAGTVEEVRTRVSPTQAVQRRTDSARQAMSDGGHSVAEQGRHLADDASSAGRRLVQTATGTAKEKPLLTGIAAFGAGLLIGALAPGSETERRAARRLQSDLEEPVRDAVSDSAHQVGDSVMDRTEEAVDHVRHDAEHAMDEVRQDAGEAAGAARERAEDASRSVRDEVQRRI
ncbi:MAG: DUF3618 domain-containing protein [Acidimicrobiales bacterium]